MLIVFILASITLGNAQTILTPKEHFGFDIGADYQLVNYTQAEAYYKKLAETSDRVLLKEIGKTEEGRTMHMMIVSSPKNLKNIDRYQEISQKLARAKNLTDEEARILVQEGKPVVWIDGGLHATETVGSHQLIETYYQLVSNTDPETLRILDDVIILMVQVNPDGQELVADWYMQESDPEKRNMMIPRLYQKYIGHDNNRDFYMMNMKETTNISRIQYIEWMPQIIYNHHQSSPAGAVVAGPPYRDPFNFVFDPLVITGIDGVGAAMVDRLSRENKPGYTRLDGSVYSTWWNGGLRTTPYFHNMIGILTEIWGSPNPSEIPFIPERLVPNNDTPFPIRPQPWKFRESIDYSVSLNYAILDYASKNAKDLLNNIYTMGKNNIEKGNMDYWTLTPKNIEGIRGQYELDLKKGIVKKEEETGRRTNSVPIEYYDKVFKNSDLRDPRGYIISANQSDFPTAVNFINALIKSGVEVQQATSDFQVNGKKYPTNSYIVKTGQAFRSHVLDMFEPQDHPNDFLYPGGPPVRPYDAAGWTLAFQMGVEFDRLLDDFSGPFKLLTFGEIQKMPEYKVPVASAGYILDAKINNSYILVNDLLKAGIEVYRVNKASGTMEVGSFYVPSSGGKILSQSAKEFGVKVTAANKKPNDMTKIIPSRIGLFDHYGGSMTSGWTRWLIEQFHFGFQVIYPEDIDKGKLNSKFDMILFTDGTIPAKDNSGFQRRIPEAKDIPEKYRGMLGQFTVEKSVPKLREFLNGGGNIVAIGSATNLVYHLNLPVEDALVKVDGKGNKVALANTDYYIPGSILKTQLDTHQPVNWGMPNHVDVVFNRSPVFRLNANAELNGVAPIAWYSKDDLLRSGWAWNPVYLDQGIAALKAKVGKGVLYAYGPEILFRGQSHSTFKLLFNTLYNNK